MTGLSRFKARNHPQQTAKRTPSLFGDDETELTDDRMTPPELFRELDAQFHFTLDVAATAANAQCQRFFTKDDDGLSQPWNNERVWCNPPYSNIETWVRKAWQEQGFCPLIVMLLPSNRTEQPWWQEQVEPWRDGRYSYNTLLRVQFLPGRLRFVQPGRELVGPNERPPFGCCLLKWERTPDVQPSESAVGTRQTEH